MTAPSFPRMPWYPRDFASSTRTWPFAARGVYRELLDAQWDIGGSLPGVLPDDPNQLRELARGVSEADWKVAWRFVARKFPRVKGGRQNVRLEEHRQIAVREYQARRRGAENANEARRSARAQRTLSARSASIQRNATTTTTTTEEVRGLRGADGTESEASAASLLEPRAGAARRA